jgi:uncharacterized damage-inducible protein DinB
MNFDLEHSTLILERTPASVRALLSGLPDEWARQTEGPETFSAFDVVGHLIDGEETDWIPRARIILAGGDDPRFQPYDRFRHRERNRGRTLDSLLEEFERLRRESLATLRSLALDETRLALPGNHPRLGRVSLRQLLSAWVVHDLGHVAQIARVMAKQYKDAVGPWVPFLPVLTDHAVPRS